MQTSSFKNACLSNAVALATVLATLVAGCSRKPLEVNEENCKIENVQKIEDKEMRQEFGGRCFMRGGGTFQRSPEGTPWEF